DLGDDGALYVADGKSGRLYRFQAPPVPALDALPPASKLRSIPISGTTEPRARIDIFTNDAAQPVSGLADAAGRFSIAITPESNALNRIEVYATAYGGDGLTSVAATAQLKHDDRPPTVGFSMPLAGAHVRGLVGVSGIAPSTSITLPRRRASRADLAATPRSPRRRSRSQAATRSRHRRT